MAITINSMKNALIFDFTDDLSYYKEMSPPMTSVVLYFCVTLQGTIVLYSSALMKIIISL
jgi:hypothetical protein